MGVFIGCGRRSAQFLVLLGLAFAADGSLAQSRDPLTVYLDQARILKLPERTATLVVGNPLIADATVQPGGTVVITGKSYGATNLVALDRAGEILMEHPMLVLGPRDPTVIVYRGIARESYSCTPSCERRIMLGDTSDAFLANLTQVTTLNTQAQGGDKK